MKRWASSRGGLYETQMAAVLDATGHRPEGHAPDVTVPPIVPEVHRASWSQRQEGDRALVRAARERRRWMLEIERWGGWFKWCAHHRRRDQFGRRIIKPVIEHCST